MAVIAGNAANQRMGMCQHFVFCVITEVLDDSCTTSSTVAYIPMLSVFFPSHKASPALSTFPFVFFSDLSIISPLTSPNILL